MQAERIKQEAAKMLEDNEQLMNAVNNQKEEAEFLLTSGQQQQQATDELLANADLALSVAQEAVTKAEKTLKEASETLKTLKGNLIIYKCVFPVRMRGKYQIFVVCSPLELLEYHSITSNIR